MSRQRSGNIIQLLANSGQLPKNTDNYNLLSNKSNERNIKQFRNVIESIINENQYTENPVKNEVDEKDQDVKIEKFQLPKFSKKNIEDSQENYDISNLPQAISLPKPKGLILIEIIRIVLIIIIGILLFSIFIIVHKFPNNLNYNDSFNLF